MIKFPFTSLQQFNLDWIMQQLHKILQFMPLNGVAGDVLQRTVDGAAWQPISAVSMDIHGLNAVTPPVKNNDEIPVYDNDLAGNYKMTVTELMDRAPVQSVCGYTGDVLLDAHDVSAMPDWTPIPSQTSDLVNDSGFVDAAGAAAAAPVQSVNGQTGTVVISTGGSVDSVNGQVGTVVLGKSDIGLGNVDNVQQYSASNPPPYPVTSVNGQTGDVIVSGSGSLLLDTVRSLTLTPPAGVTIAWQYLKGRVTDDGSCIVIYGHFCLVTSSNGWLDFSVSGLSITPPAAAIELHGLGIVSESVTISGNTVKQIVDNSDDGGDIKVGIDTSGNITISVYHAYTTSDTYIPILFPILIPIA